LQHLLFFICLLQHVFCLPALSDIIERCKNTYDLFIADMGYQMDTQHTLPAFPVPGGVFKNDFLSHKNLLAIWQRP
jgi:hypothetical protein